jgi:hypothetical protein
MFEFFLLDGMAVYVLLAVVSVIMLISVEYESPGWCSVLLLAMIALLQFGSTVRPLSYALAHPSASILLLLAYFAGGTAWIVGKWVSFVYLTRDRYHQACRALRDRGETSEPRINSLARLEIGVKSVPLLVRDYKSQLFLWWAFWPLSLLWTVIDDPLKRLWRLSYKLVASSLQNISDRAFHID